MALTPEELGISQDDWDTLAESINGSVFSVDLYRWEPDWVTHAGTDFFTEFDAIVYAGHVYRVTAFGADILGTPVAGYTAPTSPKLVPLSLTQDGATLAVFALTATGISRNTYNGSSWSDYSEIVTDSTITFIAASANDTVHFVTYDSTKHVYRFHVAILDEGWSVIHSEIYWGYFIQCLSVNRVGTRDVLVITSDAPGVQSVSVIGTKTVKKIIPSGGVFMFAYSYGSWSDHWTIDRIDQWSDFRYRTNTRLSKIDDTLWLTCYSVDGTKDTPVSGYRIYSSKDGYHWSRGELFPLPEDSVEGVVLLANDDQLYAMAFDEYYAAKRTLRFGTSHADNWLSLQGRLKDLSLTRQGIQQLQMTIDNRRNWLGATFANGSTTLAAILKTGFNNLLIQTGIFEIETMNFSHDLPVETAAFTGRDHLAWMASRSQVEQFINWNPQIVGIDEYADATNTGYGGLTHTAPAKGSFKAFDGALQLTSNNEEGLAYNVWLTDNWNGSVESSAALASLGNNEFIGVVFRCPDADNGYFYYYDQDDDVIRLESRAAAVPTTLWESSTKGWDGDLNRHYYRVDFRYSLVTLYTADSAGAFLDWQPEHQMVLDGQAPIVVVADFQPLLQAGYVGSFGRGFSDQDESDPEAGPIPEGDLPDLYEPYVPDAPITPGTVSHTFNFLTNDQGFVLTSGDGTYVLGTGWVSGRAGGVGTPNVGIYLDFPSTLHVFGISMNWRLDSAYGGNVTRNLALKSPTYAAGITNDVERKTVADTSGGAFGNLSMEFTGLDDDAEVLVASLDVAGAVAHTVTIVSITLTFLGPDPF